MGVDARYLIRFATAEAAADALADTGHEVVASKLRDGLPHVRFETNDVDLTARQDFEHRNLLVVDSSVRHLDGIFLDEAEHQHGTERDLMRAIRITSDLNFLSTVPSLNAGEVFYGHDLLDLDDPVDLPGFTPVDEKFRNHLSRFIATVSRG